MIEPAASRPTDHFKVGDSIWVFQDGFWRYGIVYEDPSVRGMVGWRWPVEGAVFNEGSAGMCFPLLLKQEEFETLHEDIPSFVSWLLPLEDPLRFEALASAL